MRLRVVVGAALVLGFLSVPVFAQEAGVKGGLGFASISAENDELQEAFPDLRTKILLGAFVDVPFTSNVSLMVEGLYNQKGAKGDGLTIKYDVLEFPVLLSVPVTTMGNIRPFIYGGMAPAFRLSSKLSFDDGDDDGDEEDLDEELKGSDVSFVFGGGVKFGVFGLEARYNMGVTDINEDSETEGSIRTRQFAILASLTFPRP